MEQRLSGETGKMTLLYSGWGFKDYKADTKPQNFSDELLGVLWKDAYYNLDARNMILQSGRQLECQTKILQFQDYHS